MSAKVLLACGGTLAMAALLTTTLSIGPRALVVPGGTSAAGDHGERSPANGFFVSEAIAARSQTILRIINKTPFLVIVYAEGVRVGWIRPSRLGLIRGLVKGHHRFFAHSQYGTTSWGPRDVYVPGSWNLTY